MPEMNPELTAATEALLKKYKGMSPTSHRLFERALNRLPDGSTRRGLFYPPYPVYIVRGEGCKVYDVDGREYIDYTCNLGPLILGHKHPRVMQAIQNQLESGTVLGGPSELEVLMAERILQSIPSGSNVLFCSSGTEANMVGLRALRAYTGKSKVLRFEGDFHGTSDSFVEGKGIPAETQAQTIKVPFNNIEQFEKMVKKHRNELAAVFIEPVMRGIPPRSDFLQLVRKITIESGVPLAFDEVVTGFRLGRGGAQEKYGIKPDMTLLGKIVGGGLPTGVIVTSKEILDAFTSKRMSGLIEEAPSIAHAGTYNAHPLAMAAGLATMEELTPNLYSHLENMGKTLREGMEKVARKAGIIVQVVGVGSFFHIYFTGQTVVDSSSAKTTDPFLQRLYDLNMVTRGIYPAKLHCSFLSQPITSVEIEQTLAAMEDSFRAMKPIVNKMHPELIC